MRITDSLILEVWHLSRPLTRALMAPVRAASSGLLSAAGKKHKTREGKERKNE